jgi:hypothetical protein
LVKRCRSFEKIEQTKANVSTSTQHNRARKRITGQHKKEGGEGKVETTGQPKKKKTRTTARRQTEEHKTNKLEAKSQPESSLMFLRQAVVHPNGRCAQMPCSWVLRDLVSSCAASDDEMWGRRRAALRCCCSGAKEARSLFAWDEGGGHGRRFRRH